MLITVETTCPHVCFLTSIKVIKNDEICVEVAFLPHKHLTMTDQTASRPTDSPYIFNGCCHKKKYNQNSNHIVSYLFFKKKISDKIYIFGHSELFVCILVELHKFYPNFVRHSRRFQHKFVSLS